MLMILTVAALMPAIACRREPERRFELKGKVVSVDKNQQEATIAHEEIKGYMDAMIMPL